MALASASLSGGLKSGWLPVDGGGYPSSAAESADAFAGAVTSWFSAATAGPFPCATATARRSQLASAATPALQAGTAAAAGAQLALALTGYLTGQVFGPGVASAPLATSAAGGAITAAFADVDQATSARADQIALAVLTLAMSTIVIFPPVISPPAPVT